MCDLLDRRFDTMRRELTDVLAGKVEAIHRMRVASRRLREALPVLAAGDDLDKARSRPPRRVGRGVRRLTRTLGTVRELDVALALLDELPQARPLLRGPAQAVRQVVAWEREVRRGVMTRRLEKANLADLRREIRARAAKADADAPPRAWVPMLAARIARRAPAVTAAIEAAGGLYAPERLHGVRIAVKKLRYALELAGELAHVPAERAIDQLKQMQELLGRMHDLEVLAGYTRLLDLQASTRGRQHARIAVLLNTIEEEVRLLHAAYLDGRPALEAVVAQCRREFCPRLARGGTPIGVRGGRRTIEAIWRK